MPVVGMVFLSENCYFFQDCGLYKIEMMLQQNNNQSAYKEIASREILVQRSEDMNEDCELLIQYHLMSNNLELCLGSIFEPFYVLLVHHTQYVLGVQHDGQNSQGLSHGIGLDKV